jgi:hypothetical protein
VEAELEKRLRKRLAEMPERLRIERTEIEMFKEEGDDGGRRTSEQLYQDLITEQRLIEAALLGDFAAVAQLQKLHMLPGT